MATPENTFIASVHRHLPHELYRMKNHNQYNGGIPDVWYSGPAGDLWIEYKFIMLPKHDDTLVTINLSELQKNWILSRTSEGRQVGVIVGCKEGGVYYPGETWNRVISTCRYRSALVPRCELASIITSRTTR